MGKNYFTDEQIDNVIKETFNLDSIPEKCTDYVINAEQLKSLMNLAVEAAIGETLAYGVKLKSGMYGRLYTKENEAIDDFTNWRSTYQEFEVLPFHKIQELEN